MYTFLLLQDEPKQTMKSLAWIRIVSWEVHVFIAHDFIFKLVFFVFFARAWWHPVILAPGASSPPAPPSRRPGRQMQVYKSTKNWNIARKHAVVFSVSTLLILIILYMFSFQYWTDVNLQWDPKNYGNLTSIHIKPSRIWLPDMTLYNK